MKFSYFSDLWEAKKSKAEACLDVAQPEQLKAVEVICESLFKGGKLLLCGNGGSYADCLHISGELLKTFEKKEKLRISFPPGYDEIEKSLERGLSVVVLGLNPILNSAFINDCKNGEAIFAQECNALCKNIDVVWGISTSGSAKNVNAALLVARHKMANTIALTGTKSCVLGKTANVHICTEVSDSNRKTALVQEKHIQVYHSICRAIEEVLSDD